MIDNRLLFIRWFSAITLLLFSIGFTKASNDPQILKMSLSNDSLFYNTIVALTHDGTHGVDRLYDARLFSTNPSNVRVYSMINGERYAIQGVPYLDWRVDVSMGIYTPHEGDFDFKLDEKTDFPASYIVKLYDHVADQFHDFNTDSTYTFTSDSVGFYDDRFSLIIQEPNVIEWDGTSWSNTIGPDAMDSVVLGGDYSLLNDGVFEMDNLFVASIATMTVEEDITFDVPGDITCFGDLIVASGGSLITYEGNSIDTSITILRNTRFDNDRYSMVGSPIVYHESLLGVNLGLYTYSYNENQDFDPDDGLLRWQSADSRILTPGKGYTQAYQEEISFTGQPNQGTITVDSISHTTGINNPEAMRGWNLVANPYPCAIDPALFFAENAHLDGQLAIWDHNVADVRGDNDDYLIVNSYGAAAGPNGGEFTGYIGSMQGFFVRLTNEHADTSVVFTESMRVTGNNNDSSFFRKSTPESIRVLLENEKGSTSNTLVLFSDQATENFDRLFDARLFSSSNTGLKVYTSHEGTKLAIQGLPTSFQNTIPIDIEVPEQGTYKISLETKTDYALLDLATGARTKTTEAIWLSKGTYSDQFVLINDNLVSNSDPLFHNEFQVYTSEETLHIVFTAGNSIMISSLSLVDLAGRSETIPSLSSIHKNHWSVDRNNIPQGIYALTFQTQDRMFTRKILLD